MCYFLLSVIFMLLGFVYFQTETKNKHLTPAMSRYKHDFVSEDTHTHTHTRKKKSCNFF